MAGWHPYPCISIRGREIGELYMKYRVFNRMKKGVNRIKDFICMLGSRINIRAFVVYTIICAIVNLGLLYFELKEIFVEGGVDFFPDYYRNYIYMLMIFCGYCAYIWKKRQVRQEKGKQMDIKKKIWTVVLLLVHIYTGTNLFEKKACNFWKQVVFFLM